MELRIRNSAGKYDYKTITVTVKRHYTRLYYLTDHLGSVRVTVNDEGDPVGWDDYYPFGLQMPGRTQNASNPNDDSKFTGYLLEQEGDLGIYHAEARLYDPVIGRFMSVDPLASEMPSWNPYHYTFNNPVNLIDPSGLQPEDPEEILRFSFDELGDGLAFMLQLSLSGTEGAVETVGFLVENSEGEVDLVVFDNSMNTASTSDNPRIDSEGRHNEELVVAQIHTHPSRPTLIDDKIADGNPMNFSDADHEFAKTHNIPVFTVGHKGRMGSTLGSNETRKHHPEANRWLRNRDNEGFLQTVNNRGREQQQ